MLNEVKTKGVVLVPVLSKVPLGYLLKPLPRVDAKFFRGLSDPTRLLILELLLDRGETNVSRLVELLELPRTRVATHLACLRDCGYVSVRREGRFHYYSVSDGRVREILSLARSLSTEHKDALTCCQIIEGFTAGILLPPQEMDRLPNGTDTVEQSQAATREEGQLGFGSWLHERLRERGLSPKAAAQTLGVSTAAVHRWLYRGGYPSLALRPRLAEALDLPADQVRAHARTFSSSKTSAFATWLDRQLQQRDWTRAELARRLGLEFHAIGPWFRRGVQPRSITLQRLAMALGVSVQEIPPAG